ncbi:MAG: hypothetical protein QW594_04555 [Candidatus Woesearchaeota archaeon]
MVETKRLQRVQYELLNAKQTRQFLILLEGMYEANALVDIFKDYVVLRSQKKRVMICNKEVFTLPLEALRIDTLGLYLGTLEEDGFRLSIEGCQLLFPYANKKIPLAQEQFLFWLQGQNLQTKEVFSQLNRVPEYGTYAIFYYKNHAAGCGKITKEQILNFLPKVRRLQGGADQAMISES